MVTMPGIALMIVTSDWLVRVMLGPQWVETGRIFAILGVMGILEPVSFTLGGLMVLLWWAGGRDMCAHRRSIRPSCPALVAPGTVAILLFLFRRATGFSNPFLGLFISFVLAVLIAAATYFVLPAGRRALQDVGVCYLTCPGNSRELRLAISDWGFPFADCGLSSPIGFFFNAGQLAIV